MDECLPRALKRLLRGHTCRTVQEMGWSGMKNGALLFLAEGKFDALITIDQGSEYQQDLEQRRIAILLLVSRSNQIEDLAPIVPAALTALQTILPGQVVPLATFRSATSTLRTVPAEVPTVPIFVGPCLRDFLLHPVVAKNAAF